MAEVQYLFIQYLYVLRTRRVAGRLAGYGEPIFIFYKLDVMSSGQIGADTRTVGFLICALRRRLLKWYTIDIYGVPYESYDQMAAGQSSTNTHGVSLARGEPHGSHGSPCRKRTTEDRHM